MANNITILVRADTAANWASKNDGQGSLLRMREIGYDQTNRRFKVGNGTTYWNDLPYVKPDVVNDLITGGVDAALSAEQGKTLKQLVDECIESISTLEQNITQVVADGIPTVIDNLTSTSTTDTLSANQGRVLKGLIDGKTSIAVINSLPSTSTTDALSANQGRVLKDLIPTVVNKLNSTSTTDALSAYMGKTIYDFVMILQDQMAELKSEEWTFTLEDKSTVTKKVVIK